jgi:hypothetical protein
MKDSEILELIAALKDRFPKLGAEFTARNARAYAEDLRDLDYEIALSAVRQLAATCTWFPAISEIRNAYADLATPTPDADQAWSAAIRHGNKTGWGRIHTDWTGTIHPAIEDAIQGLGGWRSLGRSTNQDIDRAHFIKLYAMSRKRHRDKVIIQPLLEDAEKLQLRGRDEESTGTEEDKIESTQPTSIGRSGRR